MTSPGYPPGIAPEKAVPPHTPTTTTKPVPEVTRAEREIMRTVYINVTTGKASVIDAEHSLDAWYDLIGCRLVEMVERRIGRKRYTVICDEEGTFRPDCKISAISNMGEVMFVGSLLIVNGPDEEGNTQELTEEDAEYIMERIEPMCTRRHPEPYMMLTQCEY